MDNQTKQTPKNAGFSSSLGFLFAAVAASVGLSNIWRFSSETAQNGGAIFVFFYLLCMVLVGYPVILAEISLGRSKQKGLYEAYEGHGRWKWVGVLNGIVLYSIFCFYNVVAGWVIGYLWKVMNGSLFQYDNNSLSDFRNVFEALRSDWAGNLFFTLIMIAGAVVINRSGVSGGIEKCSKILMPCFVLLMVGLLIYGAFLPGAGTGISFYLVPSLDKINMKALAKALSQAFMSLSAGMGSMIVYGAYVNRKDNMKTSSIVIVAGDTLVAFIAGFFIFSFLGNLHVIKEIDLTKLSEEASTTNQSVSGTGLAFITLPLMFKNIGGITGTVLAGSFFLLLIFAAITSSISLLEGPTKYIESRYKIERTKAISLLAAGAYIGGALCIFADSKLEWVPTFVKNAKIGNAHELFQSIVLEILAPLSALLFSLFIAYKWKMDNLFAEINQEGRKTSKYLVLYMTIALKYVCPALIGTSLCYSTYLLINKFL